MSAARERWLDEGVAVLAEEGETGLRIDRLAARLGLSKGSFHHHFEGAEGFRRELLAHIEQLLIGTLRSAVAEPGGGIASHDVLAQLTALLGSQGEELYRPRLEVAMRAWATWDADAARTQAAVDEARLGILREIWRPIAADDEHARLAALLPYLIAVGATVVVPPVTAEDLHRLYQQLLPLVPGAPAEVDPRLD